MTSTDEDPPTHGQITEASEIAHTIFDDVIDQQGDHPGGVAFALWAMLSRYLVAERGWTPEELSLFHKRGNAKQ